MSWFRRTFFFLLTNFLIFITLAVVFGVVTMLYPEASQFQFAVIIAVIFGMGGAFISLQLSRWTAKKFMGVQLIDASSTSERHKWVYEKVSFLAKSAGLAGLPEVGVYGSPEVNAFATGPSEKRSLVAVSEGLLNRMGDEEIEAVLAHEISHIKNGDMVTMALLQGVINTLVLLLSRIIAEAVTNFTRRDSQSSGFGGMMTYFATYMVLNIVFSMLGSIVTCYYSRSREFRADAGAAKLVGKVPMIKALEALKSLSGIADPHLNDKSVKTFKISGPEGGFLSLFRTHPPLDKRISALEMSSFS